MTKDYSDKDLIADFNRGTRKAFDILFDRYYERLQVFCLKTIRNKEDARDILQEIFTNLFRKREDFDNLNNIEAFLFVAARNRCFDYLRHRKRLSERDRRFIKTINDAHEVSNDRIDAEFLLALKKSIANLPDRSRQVIELYYLDDLKYKDIAAKMNISDRTVESLLRNALQKLRRSILPITQ